MRTYVLHQTSTLLRRMAYHLRRAAVLGNEESVHDLRVATRRLRECLRVFREFYPGRKAKAIRRELHELMELTARARNGDIAIQLLHKASVPATSRLIGKVSQDRRAAKKELAALLHTLHRNDFSHKWRTQLNLENGA